VGGPSAPAASACRRPAASDGAHGEQSSRAHRIGTRRCRQEPGAPREVGETRISHRQTPSAHERSTPRLVTREAQATGPERVDQPLSQLAWPDLSQPPGRWRQEPRPSAPPSAKPSTPRGKHPPRHAIAASTGKYAVGRFAVCVGEPRRWTSPGSVRWVSLLSVKPLPGQAKSSPPKSARSPLPRRLTARRDSRGCRRTQCQASDSAGVQRSRRNE